MNQNEPVIEIKDLVRKYGREDAVNGLSLTVEPGKCYGFFGRNGAGKTTTIRCLLNLLRPTTGHIRLFGRDPARDEADLKARLAYVPDQVAFYPWMTVAETLEYLGSFRKVWNQDKLHLLLDQFQLDHRKKAGQLSKGQKVQLALVAAVCAEPELLILDEPTSGLDPIVRREFIQTVIGAYQESDPGRRTIFVSTHLISEFEGLIDQFTILEKGRAVMTLEADAARQTFKRIRARFAEDPPVIDLPGLLEARQAGRQVELIVRSAGQPEKELAQTYRPQECVVEALTLEEIFVAALKPKRMPNEATMA